MADGAAAVRLSRVVQAQNVELMRGIAGKLVDGLVVSEICRANAASLGRRRVLEEANLVQGFGRGLKSNGKDRVLALCWFSGFILLLSLLLSLECSFKRPVPLVHD